MRKNTYTSDRSTLYARFPTKIVFEAPLSAFGVTGVWGYKKSTYNITQLASKARKKKTRTLRVNTVFFPDEAASTMSTSLACFARIK